jgi:hypothetical protein
MPKNFTLQNGATLSVADNPLGEGGEGAVYEILSPVNYRNSVAKILYPDKRTNERRYKVRYMVDNPPANIQYLEQGVQVLSVTPTTISPTPTSPLTSPLTISFNSQGLPTKVNDATFTDFPLRVTLNVINSPNRKRCTTITTLLGAMKSESDTDCP